MRRLTILTWAFVVVYVTAGIITRVFFPDVIEFRPELVPVFIVTLDALLLIASFFSISLYVRSRTLTMHQIQSSLALIEEHLKKMADKS